MIILKTERLVIEEFSINDVTEIFNFSQESSMKKWIPNQVYKDIDGAKETLELFISNYKEKKLPLVYTIRLKDNTLIGHIGLSTIEQGTEIGYAVGEKHQNNGYATEAILHFSNWAKKQLTLLTIYGVVNEKNIVSCSVLEKAGFTFLHNKKICNIYSK